MNTSATNMYACTVPIGGVPIIITCNTETPDYAALRDLGWTNDNCGA